MYKGFYYFTDLWYLHNFEQPLGPWDITVPMVIISGLFFTQRYTS